MKYIFKQSVAALLAAAMLLTYPSAAVMAFAAGNYYVNYVGTTDKLITTVVSEGTVKAKGVIPPGYAFDKEKPFLVSNKDGGENFEPLFDIQGDVATGFDISPKAEAAFPGITSVDPDRASIQTYVLKPNLFANLKDGSGSAMILNPDKPNPDDPTGPSIPVAPSPYGITVTSRDIVAVTAPSFIKFSVVTGESMTGTDYSQPAFGVVTDAGGNFSNYKGFQVLVNNYKKNGNSRTMDVGFSGGSVNTNVFTLTISMAMGEMITANSEFTINYNLQDVNSLTLSVITPRSAVEDVRTSIKNAPTDPSKTGVTNTAFINLNGTEPLYAIASNFRLLQKPILFNDNPINPRIKVQWEWVPDKQENAGFVQIANSSTSSASVQIVPQQADITGSLRATISYTMKNGVAIGGDTTKDSIDTRVTILGHGKPPEFVPLTKTTNGAQVPIVAPPRELDLYPANGTNPEDPTAPAVNPLPQEFTALMKMGEGRGRAEKMVITASGTTTDAISVHVENSPVAYVFGTDILNVDKVAGQSNLKFVANKTGQVTLTFDFYVFDYTGKLVKSANPIKHTFIVKDSSPRDFAELSGINIMSPEIKAAGDKDPVIAQAYPNGQVSIDFKNDTFVYGPIELPYTAENIVLSPSIPGNKGVSTMIKYEISGEPFDSPSNGQFELNPNKPGFMDSLKIPMYLDSPRKLTLEVKAENGRLQRYYVDIVRMPQSTDSALKSLSVKNEKNEQLLPSFLSAQLSYDITVPYATRWVSVEGVPVSMWSTVTYIPTLKDKDDPRNPGSWMPLTYPGDPIKPPVGASFDGAKTTSVKVKVDAERGGSFSTSYTLNITRKDPSTNDLLSALKVKDAKGKDIAFEFGETFKKEQKQYKMRIPYSAEKLTVELLPDDKVALEAKVQVSGGNEIIVPYEGTTTPLRFDVEVPVENAATEKSFTITAWVRSEKGSYTALPYVIEVTRNDPDQDSALSALMLTDQEKKPIKAFAFNPQTTEYVITVPFKVDTVITTPKPRSPLAHSVVNGVKIDEFTTSYSLPLKPGETKTIKVETYPEDRKAQPAVYNITVTRSHPGTDARLKSLVVNGGTNFNPLFVPDKTAYTVSIPEGTKSITFQAIPADPAATMLINGEVALSDAATTPYEPLDAISKVEVIVTAEDGKTKLIYTVTVRNENLLPKSGDADLKSLTVNYGSMTPRFKPAVLNYEVAVKNNIASIDILPITQQDGATIKVMAGTKQLGDYYDNYSSALVDGDNPFSVEVTSEDGKTKKTYTINVFRKDEDKQGIYKPITPDMVDYEQSGDIVVDISQYPIVSAEVFNTLKTDYPEKTIIFEGNDYSLQVKGKDIAKLIPHEELFDFSVSFTAPDEDEIWDIILSESRNNRVEPVFIHFNHHGALPAPMLFTMSLGRPYRNLSATWNYYNEERDRIDFYGGIKTNSRGTFTVRLTHMSTYIFSDDQIVGAENKTDTSMPGSITSGGNKTNPNTGR